MHTCLQDGSFTVAYSLWSYHKIVFRCFGLSHDPHFAHHRPLESLPSGYRMSRKLFWTRVTQVVGQTGSWRQCLWTDLLACDQCIWDVCTRGKDTKKQSHEASDEHIRRSSERKVRKLVGENMLVYKTNTGPKPLLPHSHCRIAFCVLPWVGVLSRRRTPVLRPLS